MRRVAVLCLFAAVFVASVAGHARLTATNGGGGIAWQPNPANSGGCGGGTPATTPYAVWTAGQTVNLFWQVIAGDGEGPITINIDTTSSATGSTFNGNLAVTSITQDGNPTIAYHAFSFTVPATFACTGGTTGNLCDVQFKGANNWVSCITVSSDASEQTQINNNNANTCVTASNLPFCSLVNGQSVWQNPAGTSALDMDAGVQATWTSYLNNAKVFSVGGADSTGKCAAALKDLLCEITFGKCISATAGNVQNIVAPCLNTCHAVTCYCGLNATHSFLYDCTSSIYVGGSVSNVYDKFCSRQTDPLSGLSGVSGGPPQLATCAPGVNNPPGTQYNTGSNCNTIPQPPGCGAMGLLASPLITAAVVVAALFAQKRL